MKELKVTYFIVTFRILCWIITCALLGYWIYLYSLDEDISLVEYTKYYDKPDDTFPLLSLCIKNPFSPTKLKSQNQSIDAETYTKF